MGSQISIQQSETTQKSLNSTINNVLNKVNNDLSGGASSKQTIRFKVIGDYRGGGDFDITQTARVQMKALIDDVAGTASEVASQVSNSFDIDNAFDNIMEQSGIVLLQSQVAIQKTEIIQNFENNLENNIENAITSRIDQDASTSQFIEFVIGGNFLLPSGSTFTLSQDSVIEQIAETATESIVNSILSSTNINEAKASTTMSNSMKQEGINLGVIFIIMLVLFFGGIAIVGSTMLPFILIISGAFILYLYYRSYYYYCINDPNDPKYIEYKYEDPKEIPKGLYINPDFRKIPAKGDIPEGHGSPEIAYLTPEKQQEYDNLESSSSNNEGQMEKISSNIDNYMCVNGTEVQNDRSRSDDSFLFFIKPRKGWMITGWICVAIGVFWLVIKIIKNKSGTASSSSIQGAGAKSKSKSRKKKIK